MLTLTVPLTAAQARHVAKAADILKMSHAEFAEKAVVLLCRSVAPQATGRPLGFKPKKRALRCRGGTT